MTAPSDSSYLFSGYLNTNRLTSLTEIENIEYLITSNSTNMSYMFYSVSSLTQLDLSSFDTTKANNMYAMFSTMTNLKDLNLSSFNTQNSPSITSIFALDAKLERLTLGSNFNTSGKATGLPAISIVNGYTGNWINQGTGISVGKSSDFMQNYDGSQPGTYVWQRQIWGTVPWYFASDTGILTFVDSGDLGNYQTSPWNLSDSLKIDASAIKKIIFTQNVTAPSDSSYLFSNSSNDNHLTSLTEIQNINNMITNQAVNMSYMFYDVSDLTRLDLSSFDTANVTNMNDMFDEMSNLQTLNLSSFNLKQTSSLTNMFGSDEKLEELTLGENFVTNVMNTGLPEITKNNLYSGYWQFENGETVGTSVQFMDNYDGTKPGTYVWEAATDPLDPSNSKQDLLVLKSVPATYTFRSRLYYEDYMIDGTISDDNQVVVYNNRMERNWSVKASVLENQLTLTNNSDIRQTISNFLINSEDILDLPNRSIILSFPDDKTLNNNVGEIKKDISQVSIGFFDTNHILKPGMELQGTIRYQLYNTSDAE